MQNLNFERLIATLTRDEGKYLERYCVDDIPHIGIGRNLKGKGLTPEELAYLEVTSVDEVQKITEAQANHLLQNDIQEAQNNLQRFFGEQWHQISAPRREALINICFNVGFYGFKGFEKMIKAIRKSDWESAAHETEDSKAARQTGRRYFRLAAVLRTNDPAGFEVDWSEG